MTKELSEIYDNAIRNYQENGCKDYDAGIVEGIKQALKIVYHEAEIIESMARELKAAH